MLLIQNRPRRARRRQAFTLCAALPSLLLGALSTPAEAQQTVLRPIANPPLAEIQRGAPEAKTLMALPQGSGLVSNEAKLDLTVEYVESSVYNPASGKVDKLRLRGYRGTGIDPNVPYVGPTIEIRPGETVRMTLDNKLPEETTCGISGGSVNTPHCFNGTNMHTHGLWVNPAGNSDNVLISIDPGVAFQYEYNIPPDHPAGTFWYHPHRHGSTALQVSSGMSGALIIRGTRLPTMAEKDGKQVVSAHGDLDMLLKPTGDQQFAERILVFQQIQYACRDAQNQIKTRKNEKGEVVAWVCDSKDFGTIEGYDQFGPGTWAQSGRFTSVNGVILPTISQPKAGQVERWRMVHAGVRDTISLTFRKHTGRASDTVDKLKALTAESNELYIEKYCKGDPLTYHVVAADGLTMGQAQPTEIATFQPGYRWDALVTFPEEGDYCVIDTSAPEGGAIQSSAPGRRILGFVSAQGGTPVTGDTGAYLQAQLTAAAKAHMPEPVRQAVLDDLADGMKLTSFTPHEDIGDDEVTGYQTLTFNIDLSKPGAAFFEVDGQPFEPGRIDRTLMLGGVDEWKLTSDFVSHPFHIHVNPFQIVSIESPQIPGQERVDVTDKGNADTYATDKQGNIVQTKAAFDPQYAGLKGVWKDTLWIKSLLPASADGTTPENYKYIVTVRTRYQRYIGDFVLHCHILDHEDQGMMQNIRIALPDGKGGASHGHHH